MKNQVIVSNPRIFDGKAIVGGTSITVESILDGLFYGKTSGQLLTENPSLTPFAVEASKKFVLDTVHGYYQRFLPEEPPNVPIRVRHLIVALQPHKNVSQIQKAFEGVQLGKGLSLSQLSATNNYGCDDQGHELTHGQYKNLTMRDEVQNWTAINVEDLGFYYYWPCHGDHETFRFYIPALIIWGIASRNADAIDRLCPAKDAWNSDSRDYSLLNPSQKQAIAQYLWDLLDSCDRKMRPAVEEALETYWLPYLEPIE